MTEPAPTDPTPPSERPRALPLPILRRVLRERATRIGLVVAAAIGVALAFNPLLGIPGVEGALALGAGLPFIAAVLSARAVLRARKEGGPRGGMLLLEAALRGFLVWLVPVLVLVLNQLRVRNCEPGVGLAFLIVGPGMGVLLASIAATLVSLVVPRFVTFTALLIPLIAVSWGLWEFWATPAIFVYSHLAGWFPGTLYDVGRRFPLELLTYRGLTLCWILGCSLAVLALRPRAGRARRPRLSLAFPALLAFALGLAGWMEGPALGHRSTVTAIDDALGARYWGSRCIVHLPREIPAGEARRLTRDCDFRVHQAERALDVRQRAKVHAFFYRSAEEKQRWMGAGNTFIAKPWRDEVHLQLSTWPHPVLAHEVVHVVAARAAQGPFRVAGQLGGWLPDPGLIEGTAVAIDWRIHDDMDPHQWSKAMRELELLPSLERLTGLTFMSLSARVAYSAAGSFTRFYLDTYGAAAWQEAYRTGDFEGPVGEDLETLEEQWHAVLDEQVLGADALALAEVYFDRPSIFETTCPHQLATLKAELGADLAAGDDRRARSTCQEILSIDPGSAGARAILVGALARAGEDEHARTELAELEGAAATLQARAREGIADALWLRGESDEAAATYRELLAAPQSTGSRRVLQVKLLSIDAGGRQERIVRDLFLGPTGRGVGSPSIVHFAHLLGDLREDGLGPYLAARQLIDAWRYDLALALLDRALRRGLPTPELEHEAIRLQGRAAFGAGSLDRAEAIWRAAHEVPELRREAEDWLDRIAWRRAH